MGNAGKEYKRGLSFVSSWIRFKGYRATRFMLAVILIHAYFGKPVVPWLPTESELSEMTGIADFMYANPTKSAVGGYYLKVNGKTLNCDVGYYAASGGCNFPGVWWDKNKPVHATFFWMSTRWGFSDRMLHSLAQNGQQVIPPQRTIDHRIQNYETRLEAYYELFAFNVFLLVLSWLIEWRYAKHNSSTQAQDQV